MKSLTGYTDLFLSPVDGSLSSTLQLPVLDPGVLWLGAIDHKTQQPITSNFDLNKLCDLTDPLNVLPCLLKLKIANLPYLLEGEKPYVEFARAIPGVDYLTVADEEEILAALAIDIIGAVIGKSKNDPNKPPKHTIEVDIEFRGLPNNLLLTDEQSGKVLDFDKNLNHNVIVGINCFAPNYDKGDTSTSLVNNLCFGVNSMLELGVFCDNNIVVGNNSLKTAYNSGIISIGHQSIENPIMAKNLIAIGNKALQDFGGFNLGNILNPFKLIFPGSDNIAIGHEALNNLPNSSSNIGIGYRAMGNIACSNFFSTILNIISDDIPIGTIESFLENTGGSVAIGHRALEGSPGGLTDGSIAIGYEALKSYDPWTARIDFSDIVKHADFSLPCIGIGFKALNSTRSGSSNLAIGHYAAFNLNFDNADPLTAESRHIAIGDLALFKFSSKNWYEPMRPNLAIGVEALGGGKLLSKYTTFRGCMGIGDQALFNCHTGQFCMGIGIYADVEETDLVNAIAIGPYSKVASSHSMTLGGYDTAGTAIYYPNIGIGTNDPLYALHVGGTRENSTGGLFLDFSKAPRLGDNVGSLLYSAVDISDLTCRLYVETNAHGVMELGAPITLTGDILGTGDASNNVNTKFAPNPTFEGEATFNGSSEFVGQSTFDDLAIFNGEAIQLPCDSAMPSNPLKGMIRFSQVH